MRVHLDISSSSEYSPQTLLHFKTSSYLISNLYFEIHIYCALKTEKHKQSVNNFFVREALILKKKLKEICNKFISTYVLLK